MIVREASREKETGNVNVIARGTEDPLVAPGRETEIAPSPRQNHQRLIDLMCQVIGVI